MEEQNGWIIYRYYIIEWLWVTNRAEKFIIDQNDAALKLSFEEKTQFLYTRQASQSLFKYRL